MTESELLKLVRADIEDELNKKKTISGYRELRKLIKAVIPNYRDDVDVCDGNLRFDKNVICKLSNIEFITNKWESDNIYLINIFRRDKEEPTQIRFNIDDNSDDCIGYKIDYI